MLSRCPAVTVLDRERTRTPPAPHDRKRRSGNGPEPDPRAEFHALCSELVSDDGRNRRTWEDVVESVRAGRSPLVLTERKEHLDRLEALLLPRARHVITLRAEMGRRQRRALDERLEGIARDEARVLIATGRPRLDTLLLTLPVAWKGTVAGRLHRLYDGEREARIYD